MADFINIGTKENSPEKVAYINEHNIPEKYWVSAENIMLIVWAINQLKATAFTGSYNDLTDKPDLFANWAAGSYGIGRTVFHSNAIWLNTTANNTSEPVIGSSSWKLLAQINEGGVLGVNWENITGNQASINLSGFTNNGNGIYPFATLGDLADFVAKVEGKDLSSNDFTDELRNKLLNLTESSNFVGTFPTIEALIAAYPDGLPGGYADVGVPLEEITRYEWSQELYEWEIRKTSVTSDDVINNSEVDGESTTNALNYLKGLVEALAGVSFLAVEDLPEAGEPGIIYLVPNGGEEPNVKDEYIWVNDGWELIGTTEIDLSNYLLKSDVIGAAGQLPFTNPSGEGIEKRAIKGADFGLPMSGGAFPFIPVWQSWNQQWAANGYSLDIYAIVNTVPLRITGGQLIVGNATESYCAVPLGQLETLLSAKENLLTAGANINIDRTDPDNPVISSTGGGGITALTGDVVASGTGSVPATIQNNTVTNAKMANMPGFSVKAKTTTGSGAPTDLAISNNSTIGRAGSGNVTSLSFGAGIVINGTTINTYNGSYTATQVLTNGTWVDNKPIYKITYTGSNTASLNVSALNIATLIDIEGTFTVTTPSSNSIVIDCNAFMLGEFDPSEYINSKAVYNRTTQTLSIDLLEGDFGGLPRVVSPFAWIITLYYTKP